MLSFNAEKQENIPCNNGTTFLEVIIILAIN